MPMKQAKTKVKAFGAAAWKKTKQLGQTAKKATYNTAKAKQSNAYKTGKNTISTNSIKTSTFGSLSKTARQAKSRVKSIYGTGNSQGLQKIADSQKKYAAATKAQEDAVKQQKQKTQEALDKLQANTLSAAALGSRKKSRVTE